MSAPRQPEAPDAGLFVSSHRSARIERHFARLQEETAGLVAWRHVFNPCDWPAVEGAPTFSPKATLQARWAEAGAAGMFLGGQLDLMIIPCVLAAGAERVWVMEFDVDYTGRWDAFFEAMAGSPADLLTTMVFAEIESPGWSHWITGRAPGPWGRTAACAPSRR